MSCKNHTFQGGFLWVVLLLLLFPAGIRGEEKVYSVETVPNVHLTDGTRYLSDPEGVLSRTAADSINRMLYGLDRQTGIQVAVVILPSIGDEDCFDFTHRLFERWGVGQKGIDNGLVMLVVKDQRCIQMETGYGLEGDLPDAIAKRIQLNDMIPYLGKGDWDTGMVEGVKAVCARLDGTMVREEQQQEEAKTLTVVFACFFLAIALLILFSAFKTRREIRCPMCKKYALQRENSVVLSRKNGIKTEQVTFVCRNCGNRLTRIVKSDDRSGFSGGAGPLIGGGLGGLGGGLGRGFGGGGFGGGFGGGRTGGGGAGSRF